MDGLAVDFARLEETKGKIEAEIAGLEADLAAVADYEFNPLSPAQVKKYLYEHKGIKPYLNAAGGVTTDDKALSRIIRKHPELREPVLIQSLRGLKKLKSVYLDVETDADGRLRCSWNPRGTWTGRLSSSQTIFGRGLNLQNLDPRFKGFIVEDVDDLESSRQLIAAA
jgi:DNA polymerase I-like protein with 3'-5' exonuclease and polymerase domains